jgi:hypothetical protein
MPFSKYCTTVFKVYNVNKELGDEIIAYLAGSDVTKKKFKDTIPTLSRIG